MRVVFRTQGDHQQGMGDVRSSIALADEFRMASDEVLFLLSGGPEATEAVREKGYHPVMVSSFSEEREALYALRPDVVIVNKLNNQPAYIRTLKQYARLTVTVDDTGEGAQYADLRFNVLYHTPNAVTGPEYISLSGEFQEVHERAKKIREKVPELLLTQGGSDTYGFTPAIIRSLEVMNSRPHCTVVVGPAFRHESELEEAVKNSSLHLDIVRNARNMAELMYNADLAITAGGITMFELACVGTPAVVVCGEPFELETAERLEWSGAVMCLGFGGSLDYSQLPQAVDALCDDKEKRREMSGAGKSLVDGKGSERVVRVIRNRVEKVAAELR